MTCSAIVSGVGYYQERCSTKKFFFNLSSDVHVLESFVTDLKKIYFFFV